MLGGILLLLRRKKNKNKAATIPKSEETAVPMSLPQSYQYNSVPVHEGDCYEHAAEGSNHAPFKMGIGEGTRELRAVSKSPTAKR